MARPIQLGHSISDISLRVRFDRHRKSFSTDVSLKSIGDCNKWLAVPWWLVWLFCVNDQSSVSSCGAHTHPTLPGINRLPPDLYMASRSINRPGRGNNKPHIPYPSRYLPALTVVATDANLSETHRNMTERRPGSQRLRHVV